MIILMNSEERDLQRDLEICEQATPGPWEWGIGPGPLCVPPSGSLWGRKEPLDGEATVPVIDLSCDGCGGRNCKNEHDRLFFAEAREGWPEAIERALAAEAKVKELEHANDSALRLSGYMVLRAPATCGERADIYFRGDGEQYGGDLWDFLRYEHKELPFKPFEWAHVEIVIRRTPAPEEPEEEGV